SVAALGAIGDPAGKAAVLDASAGDRPSVRRRAVVALAAFDGDDVDAALTAALADRDWQVRQAAEELSAE
ncbi:MAG: HEAT repeat domain-containing protein, partial [Acidimicrobiales bacterium]